MEENRSQSIESNKIINISNMIDNDTDVIIVNKIIPEIIVNDNSTDCIATPDLSLLENDSDQVGIKSESPTTKAVKEKSEEEHFADFVVLDDDISEFKRHLSAKSNDDCIDIDFTLKFENIIHLNENEQKVNPMTVKPELNSNKDDDKQTLDNLKTSTTLNNQDLKIRVSSQNEDSSSNTVSCVSSISANEVIVLQMDAGDAFDSYLHKPDIPLDSTPENSFTANNTENNELDINKINNNNMNRLNSISSKITETDSLILTADDELETEMSLTIRDKKDKVSDSILQTKSLDVSKELLNDNRIENIVLESKPAGDSTNVPNIDIKIENNATDKSNYLKETTSLEKICSGKIDSKKHIANAKRSDFHSGTSRVLWVSNVTHSVKATDLKQYISKVGKVMTAKVVTDGKKCYGYVVMENPGDANECLKTLNNAYFEGKKISISFMRPPKNIPDKTKDAAIKFESDKNKSPKKEKNGKCSPFNETDDIKASKSKESLIPKNDINKRHRSVSKSQSERTNKRQNFNDPLTTKFESRKRDTEQKSRSRDRHDNRKEYLRERLERDRLKRRLLEEQRRNRDDMMRQIQREEKQREMEFRLEQERRKLQLERELFERERREWARIEAERRKIEKEKLEVFQQRTKLEEEYQHNRLKRKCDEFNLSSTIVKLPEKHKELSKSSNNDYRKEYDKSESKHLFEKSKEMRDDRKMLNEVKGSAPTHRNVFKAERNDFKSGKDVCGNSKNLKRGDDFKNYERTAPPPPKLNEDFDISIGRKTKHLDHKHDDRKSDRGRKIEVIDRKYYNDVPERRHDRAGCRKPDFAERKYEYDREPKRYREEGYSERDNPQRTPWSAPASYNDPWKPGLSSTTAISSPGRYQDSNFSAPPYGGPSRIPPFYYHPTPSIQDYPRYDHCGQLTGRKY